MTLTTHALVGAAAAKLFSFNPFAAILAAFLSHFLIDAIPHWDYLPKSFEVNKNNPLKNDMALGEYFGRDFIKIAFDASLGVAISLWLFNPQSVYDFLIILFGAGFGILPDPLQFVYWKTHFKFLEYLQRFHLWIHGDHEVFCGRWVLGGAFQLSLAFFVVFFVKIELSLTFFRFLV